MCSFVKLVHDLNKALLAHGCTVIDHFAKTVLTESSAKCIIGYLETALSQSITEESIKDEHTIDMIRSVFNDSQEIQKFTQAVLGKTLTVDVDINHDGRPDFQSVMMVEDYQAYQNTRFRVVGTIVVCGFVLLFCFAYIFLASFFGESAKFVEQSLSSVHNVISMIVMFVCNNFFWGGNTRPTTNNTKKQPEQPTTTK